MTKQVRCKTQWLVVCTPGGGGRVLKISSGRDDRMEGKIKTQKNPPKKSPDQTLTPQKSHAEFRSHKILFAELCSRDTWELLRIFRMFWIPPKNPIFQPKKIPKSKISNPPPKKILWSPLSLEIRSTPGPLPCHLLLFVTVMPLNIIKIKTVQ